MTSREFSDRRYILGLTQAKISKLTKIPITSLSNFENGSSLSVKRIESLENLFDKLEKNNLTYLKFLIADLWLNIEDEISTDDFFKLREKVRKVFKDDTRTDKK